MNGDEVFAYLISTLKPSNTLWSYFVNWEKVFENSRKLEVNLNTFNYILGKEDFDKEFKFLLREHPEIAGVIPFLVVRDGKSKKKFKILIEYERKRLVYEDFDFTKDKFTDEDLERYLTFIKKTGLKKLITSKRIKNFVDYIIGVEAGLDSNARKNRSGKAMENIVEVFIKDLCSKKGYKYLKEANSKKIKKELGYDVPVDKISRRYDFVIDNKRELFVIETNFYGGGGSKIKSTAGEYKNLFDILKDKYKFIWITDGLGWKTATRQLQETFEHNNFLFNLKMLENGVLEHMLS
ncbi:MAG: type II restriction endonuclease [Nitrospinota bacterium]